MDYTEVFKAAKDIKDEKNPVYGSVWDTWLITTLLDISTAKALRSRMHYQRGDFPDAIEEALDAINYLNKAVQRLTQE